MTDAENKAKDREYQRKRRAKNPEENRERARQWIANNLERAKASQCEWRAKNVDKVREYQRKRAAANPEKTRRKYLTRMFAGVVDVEKKELLVETKLLQLSIKNLLQHGEANEKRSRS